MAAKVRDVRPRSAASTWAGPSWTGPARTVSTTTTGGTVTTPPTTTPARTPVVLLRMDDRSALAETLASCWAAGTTTWVVDPDASRARLEHTGAGWFRPGALDELVATGHARIPVPVPTDTATIVTSSGTTGAPKVLPLSAAAMDASADGAQAHLGLTTADRWLLALPLHHVAGQSVVWRARRLGHDPQVQDRFDPAGATTATVVSLVPTQLRRLVDADDHLDATVLLGGGAISPQLLDDTAAGAHVRRVVRSYGLTETAGGCVYDGEPFAGVEVIAPDGRLRVRGPVLATGRLGPDGVVSIVDDAGWLRTDDLGSVTPGGRVGVVGRADDVIITGGVNVSPAAVEATIEDHPGVLRAGVVGLAHDEWGELVVAAVTTTAGATTDDLDDEVRAMVHARLGAPAVPRRLVVVDRLDLTALGKVDRRALRSRLGGSSGAGGT